MPLLNVIATLFISLFGTLGNVTIIYVFIKYKQLRCVNNIFVVQLSIVDLIKSLILLPLKAATQISMDIHLNKGICLTSGFLSAFAFVHAPLVLAAIAALRYIIVVKPHLYLILCSRPRVLKYSMFLVTVAFLFALLPFIGAGTYEFSIHHGVCFTNWSHKNMAFRIILYILTMGISYPIMILCYGRIFLKLKKHNRSLSRSMSSIQSLTRRKQRRYSREKESQSYDYSKGEYSKCEYSNEEDKMGNRNKLYVIADESAAEASGIESNTSDKVRDEFRDSDGRIAASTEIKTSEKNESDRVVFPMYLRSNKRKSEEKTWVVSLSTNQAQASVKLNTEDRTSKGIDDEVTPRFRSKSCTLLDTLKNESIGNANVKSSRSMDTFFEVGYINEASGGHYSYINDRKHYVNGEPDFCNIPEQGTYIENEESDLDCIRESVIETKTLLPSGRPRNESATSQEVDCSLELLPMRRRMSRMEVKVTKTMFVIVLAYTISWLPAFLVNILMLSSAVQVSDNLLYGIVTLVDLKVLLNPLIYGIGSPMIRSAIRASVCKNKVTR